MIIDVSIVVPIYNTDLRRLKNCIESIRELIKISTCSIECLLIDDGSERTIEDFCKDYTDDKIKYFRKAYGGAGSARNYGINKALGSRIMFVDSDDEIIPSASLELLTYDSYDIVFSDLEVVRKTNTTSVWRAFLSESGDKSHIEVLKRIAESGKLNGPVCKLIKRDFLIQNDISFPENMITGEDAYFLYRMLAYNPGMHYCKKITYRYYYDESETGLDRLINHTDNFLDCNKVLLKEYVLLIDKHNIDDSLSEQMLSAYISNYIKHMFNSMLGLSKARMLTLSVRNKIRESGRVANDVGNTSIKYSWFTKLRIKITDGCPLFIIYSIALIRRCYLYFKSRLR